MELLIFKSGTDYIRFREDSYELTDMDKASVYPLEQADEVKQKFNELKDKISSLSVKKILISETDYL